MKIWILIFAMLSPLASHAEDTPPFDRLTPEEIEFVRKARKEFEEQKKQRQASKQLQDRVQSESEVPIDKDVKARTPQSVRTHK